MIVSHRYLNDTCIILPCTNSVNITGTPVKEEEEKEGKKTIDIGKEAAIEAEVRAARERAIVPLETRIKSFRDMLAEKDVSHHRDMIINLVYIYATYHEMRLDISLRL